MRKSIGILFLIALMAVVILFVKSAGPVVVKNEVILPRGPGQYMEVRHIVLRGSSEEIGRAIGEIGQKWLGIKLPQSAGPLYAKAQQLYLRKNYPILVEKSEGVARSYGVSPDDDKYNPASLFYDVAPFACSTVYYPPSSTENGHPLLAHNMDFYKITLREFLGMEPVPGEHKFFTRNFVMETYPDEGHPSLVVGSLDLLNGGMSGMNSKGLVVAILAEHKCPTSDNMKVSGLTAFQLARLLLDTCETVEQAKIAILNNRMVFSFEGVHFQVADRFGNSFICDIDPKDFSYHFTDNDGRPQVMTNHSQYLYPEVGDFPPYSPKATYNTFYRYRRLHNYVQDHKGKFSAQDALKAMSMVYAHTHDVEEGAALSSPCRTFWTQVYDIEDGSLETKFYLKDGPVDPETGDPTLIFSRPFKFRLKDE